MAKFKALSTFEREGRVVVAGKLKEDGAEWRWFEEDVTAAILPGIDTVKPYSENTGKPIADPPAEDV